MAKGLRVGGIAVARARHGACALLLLLPFGCAPSPVEPSAARVAAEGFLGACARGQVAEWQSRLVREERSEPRWSPHAMRSARILAIEQRGEQAIASLATADPNAPLHPLVLQLEDGVWRVSLGASLAAWASEPGVEGPFFARR